MDVDASESDLPVMRLLRLPLLLTILLFAVLLAGRGLGTVLPAPDVLSYSFYTRADQSRVYWMEARRGIVHRWRDDVLHGVSGAEWTRGGTRVAYMRQATGARVDLEVYDLNTGEDFIVTNFINRPDQYAWSPDGECLLFISFAVIRERCMRDDDSQLVWADSFGGNIRALDWSPDGTRVAYTYENDDGYHLALLDRETQQAQRLTDEYFYKSTLSFSANGENVTYLQTREGITRLLVADVEGTGVSVLPLDDNIYSTSISPYTDQLAYMRYDNGKWRLYLFDVAQNRHMARAGFPRVGRTPSWVR